MTLSCMSSVLAALQATDSPDLESRIIVVDNGSDASDLSRLKQGLSEIVDPDTKPELQANEKNLGYAGGMNTGIDRVRDWKPDYIWLLNNDTEVDPGAISALIAFSKARPGTVMTGATMANRTREFVLAAGGYRYFPWLGWNRPCLAGQPLANLAQLQDEPRLDYVDGAAMWLKGEFIQRTGGIPEDHYLFFEELELNQSLKPDETVGWCREALVYHLKGGAASTPEMQARSAYHAAFSAFSYTRRYAPLRLPTVILARLAGIGIRAVHRRQPGLFVAIVRALSDFLAGRFNSEDSW